MARAKRSRVRTDGVDASTGETKDSGPAPPHVGDVAGEGHERSKDLERGVSAVEPVDGGAKPEGGGEEKQVGESAPVDLSGRARLMGRLWKCALFLLALVVPKLVEKVFDLGFARQPTPLLKVEHQGAYPVVMLEEPRLKVDVSFDGKRVDRPYFYGCLVGNAGEAAIDPSVMGEPIRIAFRRSAIMHCEVGHTHPPGLRPDVKFTAREATLDFKLLNPGEWVELGFVMSGEIETPAVTARVKNQTDLVIVNPGNTMFGGIFDPASQTWSAWRRNWERGRAVGAFLGSTAALVFVLVVASCFNYHVRASFRARRLVPRVGGDGTDRVLRRYVRVVCLLSFLVWAWSGVSWLWSF